MAGAAYRGGWRSEFRLLGPVEITRDGYLLTELGPQPRTVVSMLLLGCGDVVSTDRLVDAIWGERAPSEPRNAVQVYVSRLRRLLSGATGVAITTAGRHGYRMQVPPDSVDLLRFRRLVGQARDVAPERVVELLSTALSLWRGDPFGGAAGDWLHRQVTPGLLEERLHAAQARAAALVEAGRHGEATAELSTLLSENPTREQLAQQLMIALHRTGRTAEALAVFRDLRARLVDELGIEPGEPARQAHESILATTQDSTEPESATTPPVPAQLPSDVGLFVGRADLLPGLTARLSELDSHAARVVVLTGAGGTGKSALAVHLAHQVRQHFPGGQLFASLAGPVEPGDVLADFLLALGVPAAQIPHTVQQRAALYRSAVADRRLLVVLDGASEAPQVRPLLPGDAGCAVIVSSRSRLATLQASDRAEIGGLSVEESVRVLTSILGAERVNAEPAAAESLAHHCGYLPLALRICASRLTNRPQWRLATLAARLADRHGMLDELHLGDLDIRASFTLSYQQLDAESARAFRFWALAACRAMPEEAAAAMLGVRRRWADSLADSLIDLHLLELTGTDRLSMHDLLREFGRELAQSTDPVDARNDALARLSGWYVHTFGAALTVAIPDLRRPRHLLPATSEALDFADSAAAIEWLDSQRTNLVGVLLDAARRSLLPPADLSWVATRFGRYAGPRGHLEPWRQLAEAAAETAQRFGDKKSEARATVALGTIAYRTHELDSAEQQLGWAAGQLRESGSTAEATAARRLALVYASLDKRGEVTRHLDHAYQLYHQLGDPRGQASTLHSLGRQRIDVGDYSGALEHFRRSVQLGTISGAIDVQAEAHIGAADALRGTGQHADAHQSYRVALDLVRGTNNHWLEGAAVAGLAKLHATADPVVAAAYLERAVAAYREGRFDFELALSLAQLGGLAVASGHCERADTCRREARRISTGLAQRQATQVQAEIAAHSR